MIDAMTNLQTFGFKLKIRLVLLLDAAEKAGLCPISVADLHSLAYFANILAPTWGIKPLEGTVFKREDFPFDPSLQAVLDQLVVQGVVVLSEYHYRKVKNDYLIEGNYQLNEVFSTKILVAISKFQDEVETANYIQELAYAFSVFEGDELSIAVSEDATYSDPMISSGNVIDYGQWQDANFTTNVTRYFQSKLPGGSKTTSSELVHLYIQYIKRRLHARSISDG